MTKYKLLLCVWLQIVKEVHPLQENKQFAFCRVLHQVNLRVEWMNLFNFWREK